MNWDWLNTELLLLAVFSGLLAVLAVQVLELRAGMRDMRQYLLDLRDRLKDADYLVSTLPQPGAEKKLASAGGTSADEPPAPVQPIIQPTQAPVQQPPELERSGALRQDRGARAAAKPARTGSGSAFQDAAQQLYQKWCIEDRRPLPPDKIDIGYLRYAGDQRVSELGQPMHVFSDDQQTGEFVRFSAAGTDKGLAFPNPEAFYNETVHRILFPTLTADSFNGHQKLASLPPVHIQRQADGKWQKAS